MLGGSASSGGGDQSPTLEMAMAVIYTPWLTLPSPKNTLAVHAPCGSSGPVRWLVCCLQHPGRTPRAGRRLVKPGGRVEPGGCFPFPGRAFYYQRRRQAATSAILRLAYPPLPFNTPSSASLPSPDFLLSLTHTSRLLTTALFQCPRRHIPVIHTHSLWRLWPLVKVSSRLRVSRSRAGCAAAHGASNRH